MSVRKVCGDLRQKAEMYVEILADYVRTKNKRPSPVGCHLVADREANSVNAVLQSSVLEAVDGKAGKAPPGPHARGQCS
jgi:hypothetical protein